MTYGGDYRQQGQYPPQGSGQPSPQPPYPPHGQPWQQPPPQYPPSGYGQVQPYAQPFQQPPGYGQPYPPQQYWLQPQYAPPVAPKSTAAGLILGLFLPGVGCMYAGRVGIGILILGIWLISIPLAFFIIGFITGFCAWIVSAVLGYTMTREWNASHGIAS